MKKTVIICVCAALALVSCKGGGSSSGSSSSGSGQSQAAAEQAAPKEDAPRPFPAVSVPSVYGSDTEQARNYVLEHYWDAFFKSEGATGATTVLGVEDGEVEQALSNYIQILSTMKLISTPDSLAPLQQARRSVGHLFAQLEDKQKADTSALTYLRFTEMVSKYLYDPNSPMRDEDLYLPFVERMARSPYTKDDMRKAYEYEARMCRTNPYGSVAPDFRYNKIDGKKGTLHSVKADYTMLFFSNPGCNSCKQIIQDVMARGYVESYISEGKLAILNIYIDEEVKAWRDYHHNYPACWINGYDYTFSLRDSGLYDIRAIPSLYLLDSQKRVLMKDAPTERVLQFLDNI